MPSILYGIDRGGTGEAAERPDDASEADSAVTADLETARRDFPFLAQCTYLNTASAGLARAGLGQAVSRFYDDMLSRGYEGRDDWRAVAARVQERLARLLNVAPADISFTGSTTEALNLIAHSLPVAPGDRIAVAADEFPSVEFALAALVARGAEIVRVPVADEAGRTQALAEAASGARYLGVSHVHWHTGTKVDLAALSRACRQAGCALIVDGIQAAGATPVDASLADAYVASVFKWLLAGFGLGIVVTRPAFREGLTPVFRGYFNPPPSHDLRYGHISYPVLCALESSLAYLEELGWEPIFARVDALRTHLLARAAGIGFEAVTPADTAAGIVSIRCDDAEAAAAALRRERTYVEARGPYLRVSPHFYNTEAEIDRFADQLAGIGRGNPS
jgi:selenocysteine lyase/cysteine desulfurase